MKDLGKEASPSMQSAVKALDYLAMVVVQDALEEAEGSPENPVHERLLEESSFQCVTTQLIPCCIPRTRHALLCTITAMLTRPTAQQVRQGENLMVPLESNHGPDPVRMN